MKGEAGDSPIYHELDPVAVVASQPLPLSSSSFHAYQSIVDVRQELSQLRSAHSAVTTPPPRDDVTALVTTATPTSGSKWTLLPRLRLRLPRRRADHVTVSTSGCSSSPSASRGTPPSCRAVRSADVARGVADDERRRVAVESFSSPCCGVRMREIRTACRVHSASTADVHPPSSCTATTNSSGGGGGVAVADCLAPTYVQFCSSAVRDPTPWTYFLHLSSLSSVILTDSSTGIPFHVLMLSIHAVRGLPHLRAPDIVPCIITFSRQLPCFLMV